MAVDVGNCNHLEQGGHHKANCSRERVEHLQPVLASARAENQSNQEAEDAADASDVRLADPLEDVNVE